MKHLEIAYKYMEFLYDKGDMNGLRAILADDMHFKGTYSEHDTADEYIEGFEGEDMSGFSYNMRYTFEKDNAVCLVYNLIKPSGPMEMAQVFEIEDEKIKNVLLIFDGRELDDEEVIENDDDWNL